MRFAMLKKIIIKNINSIDTCEIDFQKGNYKFANENLLGNLVNPIVIFGHNGSGKSSFMNAIAHFITMMSLPAAAISPFVVNNFLFDKFSSEEKKDENLVKGSIRLFFNLNENEFEYFLETSRLGYISEEYLEKDGVRYFENKKQSYSFLGKKYNLENKNLSPLVPFLRVLSSVEISDPTIQTVSSYIRSFTEVNVNFITRGAFVTSSIFDNTNLLELLTSRSEEVHDILQHYSNFPIYSVIKDDKMTPNGIVTPQYSVVLEDKDFKKKLPIQMMSSGMQNQSTLLSLLLSMPKNSVMFIDEADIALHPSAIESFFDVIRKRGIQVLITLHNTYAMQSLRPDQIYFAKWSKGFSKFYRLSKIYPNIREINNIEKMYLSSLFDEAIEENE